MNHEMLSALVHTAVLSTIVYALLLFAVVLATMGCAAWQASRLDRTRRTTNFSAMRASRFALPVSIVASAYNEETMILASVKSLLAQDYPEFEVIVVNDGSTDRTMELLQNEFALYPDPLVHRDLLPHRPVGIVHASAVDKRLFVVTKENGGNKADAMNCGTNYARYPYLCSVDGDTLYEPDALLTCMRPINSSSEHIIGVTSFFGICRAPERADRDRDGLRMLDRQFLSNFQHLDLMRSFLLARLTWSSLDCMMCNPGGFAIWRREEFMQIGGFSNEFSCEDIEITFRMHEWCRRQGRRCRIVSLPGMVARTEGPERPYSLIRQRARWQKVVLEVVWHYRKMLLRPRYGSVGMIALPYFLLFEAAAPVIQLLSLLALGAAAWTGALDWGAYACMVGITAFAGALPSAAATALNDRGYRDYRLPDLARLLLLGPLDLFFFRPLIMVAGWRGTWQFFKGDRGWDKFDRNSRPHAAGA